MKKGRIGRIAHFNFRKPKDCELFLSKLKQETAELVKEALQRTVISVDEKSVILFAIYATERDADIVLNRIRPWMQKWREDDTMETITISGDLAINELRYSQ
tara:strand:+ start:376 stop:681 length:306 start_codon:yes stop_codon:yes gene_type:complete